MGRRLDGRPSQRAASVGPSGATPEMGTKYAMEHFLKSCNWDYQTRAYKIGPIPGQIEVHEFDYQGENIVVYDENGVVVRSWPPSTPATARSATRSNTPV